MELNKLLFLQQKTISMNIRGLLNLISHELFIFSPILTLKTFLFFSLYISPMLTVTGFSKN